MKKKAPAVIKIRKRWRINPKTRVVKSKKTYSRKKKAALLENIMERDIDEA
jgi:hypothetical protein